MASAGNDLADANASFCVPLSHVSNCSSPANSTGIRSWLMLAVSELGSVVMNA